MKRLLTSICLVLGFQLNMLAEETTLPLLQNVQAYESMSLNGDWNYIVDVQEEGFYDYRMNPMRNGFFINAKPKRPEDLIEYDFDKSDVMQIPSDWNTRDERLFFYPGQLQCDRPRPGAGEHENRHLESDPSAARPVHLSVLLPHPRL